MGTDPQALEKLRDAAMAHRRERMIPGYGYGCAGCGERLCDNTDDLNATLAAHQISKMREVEAS